MIVVDLEESHLENLQLQPAQSLLQKTLSIPAYRRDLARYEGFAGIEGDRVVAAAGAVPQDGHRAVVWALLSKDLPMVAVHRAVMRWLDACLIPRLETWVMVGHEEGERWAEMLGFEAEGRMKKFRPDGDAWLYARVR